MQNVTVTVPVSLAAMRQSKLETEPVTERKRDTKTTVGTLASRQTKQEGTNKKEELH